MAWREMILKSLKKNARLANARYAQLATVKENGRPANRTIVYRGFLNDTCRLTFVTDRRAKKIGELRVNPWVELCWYFPQTREQYRIAGRMSVVQAGDDGAATVLVVVTSITCIVLLMVAGRLMPDRVQLPLR